MFGGHDVDHRRHLHDFSPLILPMLIITMSLILGLQQQKRKSNEGSKSESSSMNSGNRFLTSSSDGLKNKKNPEEIKTHSDYVMEEENDDDQHDDHNTDLQELKNAESVDDYIDYSDDFEKYESDLGDEDDQNYMGDVLGHVNRMTGGTASPSGKGKSGHDDEGNYQRKKRKDHKILLMIMMINDF